MNARHLAALLLAMTGVASCAEGNEGDASTDTAIASQSARPGSTDTSGTTADAEATHLVPAPATEFFDRLNAITATLGLDIGQTASDWRQDGITTDQLADICANAFTGVPPAVDELTAQREFAITVAACPDSTTELFLQVHPPGSGTANTDYSVFADLVGDMIEAATARPPSTPEDAGERPLIFIPTEIAADADFLSGQFPEPPQADGSVIVRLGRVDDSIAVSFSPFDPGADTNCLAVSIMPLGAYTRLDALSGEPCLGLELDDDHPARDFYRIVVDGEMLECDGVRTVVLDVATDTLTMTADRAAALLGTTAATNNTTDLNVGAQLTTGLLEAPGPGATAGTRYFVPLTAEFPARIAPPQLPDLGTSC